MRRQGRGSVKLVPINFYTMMISLLYGDSGKLPVRSLTAEEAGAFFGWLAMFAGLDLPASSEQTREKLGWQPTGPG